MSNEAFNRIGERQAEAILLIMPQGQTGDSLVAGLADVLERTASELRAGLGARSAAVPVDVRTSAGTGDYASLMRRVEAEFYDAASST